MKNVPKYKSKQNTKKNKNKYPNKTNKKNTKVCYYLLILISM